MSIIVIIVYYSLLQCVAMLYNGLDMTWHYLWESEKQGWPQASGASEHRMTASINAIQGWLANRRVDKVLQLHSWRSEGDEQPAHVKGLYKTSESFTELLPEFQTLEPRLRSFQWEHLWCSRRLILPKRIETQEARRRLNGGYRLQQRLNTQGQRSQTWNEDALLKSTSRSSRSKKEQHSSLCGSAW